jgi:hypothetical protein
MVKPVNIDELNKNIDTIIMERDELAKGRKNLPDVVKRLEVVDEGIIIAVRQDDLHSRSSALGTVASPFVNIVKQLKRYFWDIY